jgi:hypothetical protein
VAEEAEPDGMVDDPGWKTVMVADGRGGIHRASLPNSDHAFRGFESE